MASFVWSCCCSRKTPVIQEGSLLGRLVGRAALKTHLLEGEDSGRILVTSTAARVLALFDDGDSENSFLWLQPDVASGEAVVGEEFVGPLGGERLWLAPEKDLFFPQWPDVNAEYKPPWEVDPGRWSVASVSASSVTLTASGAVQSYLAGGKATVRLERRISSTQNPARDICRRLGVTYAGFMAVNSIEYVSSTDGQPPIALWSLLQLKHGGTAAMRLCGPGDEQPATRLYFGEVPDHHVCLGDRGDKGVPMEYAMKHTAKGKIGVRCSHVVPPNEADPTALQPCTVCYTYQESSGPWCAVVKAFSVAPGPVERFIDAPPTDTGDSARAGGDSVQFCVFHTEVGKQLWKFSEVEHHALSIGPGERSQDRYAVYAFRGTSLSSVTAAADESMAAWLEGS